MKKILIQFAAFFLVIACIFIFTGKTDGWIEPPEEAPTGDIILSGTKYSGKVVIKVTLRPDGSGEHEGNGDVVPATWEMNEDGTMTVHFNVKGTDYDMIVRDDGVQYVADYPIVADMQLTGAKPVKDIILSGTKYSGKVVIKVTLHGDGTGEHEGNGDTVPATWETNEDGTMTVHFNVKGTDYDMIVRDDGVQYVADYPIVADMQLTGAKNGAAPAPAAEQSQEEQPAAQSEEPAPAAEAAPAAESEAPAYAADTLLLEYVADINAQLTGSFSCPPERWKAALGESGSYTPTESEDLLFSWDATGKSKKMDFYANGTYEFQFTSMSISEKGKWTYADGKLAVTTEGGKEYAAEQVKGEEPAPAAEAAPAPAAESEAPAYAADTLLLEYVADINAQLTGSFSCPPERWKAALGESGSYTPTESEDLLFSWDATGKSKKMDFYANGTYEFQFTSMSISEKGKWTYADGKLAVTTEGGKEYAAEQVKGEESAPAAEAAPAPAAESEAPAYAVDTLLLEYVADINAQLTGSFSCPPERWKAALGESGSYTPTESEDLLFSWDATGKSKKMDFYANGTFEFQFTTMSISEKGTWTYADGKLAVTTAGGKEYVADLTK